MRAIAAAARIGRVNADLQSEAAMQCAIALRAALRVAMREDYNAKQSITKNYAIEYRPMHVYNVFDSQ